MDANFFTQNRERLTRLLPHHLLVIPAHSTLQYSADLAYPFRQDSNFWYVTGINEPDCVLVINTKSGESTLLLPQQNTYQKQWDGAFDCDDLSAASGVAAFGSIVSLRARVLRAKKQGLRVGYMKPLPERLDPYGFYTNPSRRRVAAVVESVVSKPTDIRPVFARMRQKKQSCEIDAIQKAIDITAYALNEAKLKLNSYATEKDLERAITAGFFTHGADGHAYTPIVAAGPNAAIIHYQKNDQPLLKNQMVLLDVGANYRGYAADISRTWALGAVSQRQKELYSAVSDIQLEAISRLKPGVILQEYQKDMEAYALRLQKSVGVDIQKYPHGFSHFLGLDVHDAGDYASPLEPGVVLTVEPGIYLSAEGIGIRIEDNVLITKSGCTVLSKDIPRTL